MTNPAHDDITEYLRAWSQSIKSSAEKKGHKFLELEAKKVKKENVEKFLKKQNPKFVIFHGHGGKDCICGFGKEEIIVKKNLNDHLLKNKIIYSVTCESASELGTSVIKKGGIAFVGFKEEVWCPFDPSYMSDPLKDEIARCNLEPIMLFSQSVVKGNTVEEAYQKSQNCFKRWLDRCQRSDAPYELQGLAVFIHWNMINQEIIGDKTAVLK